MSSASPVRDGFAAAFRQPLLLLGELTWRWSFGAAFWALAVLSCIEYLGTLPVTPLSWLMWRTGIPPLMSQAFTATIAGSGFRLLRIAAVLVPGYAVLWTVAYGLGRFATLRALLPNRTVSLRSMFGLGFFRAALTLAGLIGFAGAFAMATRAYSDGPGAPPHAATAVWILVLVIALIAYLWSLLCWFLTLAGVMAALGGGDAISCCGSAVSAFRQRKASFIGTDVAFAALHLVIFVAFTFIAFFALGFAGVLPGWGTVALLIAIALLYFAIIDCLHMAKLAAYVDILSPADLVLPSSAPVPYRGLPPVPVRVRP